MVRKEVPVVTAGLKLLQVGHTLLLWRLNEGTWKLIHEAAARVLHEANTMQHNLKNH
jgi:hypothetical protein